MADTEAVVYLEDVEVSATGVNSTASTSGTPTSSPPTVTTTTVKRQRTLQDMFAGSSEAKSLGPVAKKAKLSVAGSSASTFKGVGFLPLNSIPFSTAEFLESLSEDQRRLLKLECDVMGKSWLKLLKDEIKKPYFIKLKQFLWDQGVRGENDSPKPLKVYPAPKDIYSWSNTTPLGKVKIVIVGQDPYHGPGQAHGLCFSVPMGVTVPPSLKNIYAEIQAEYPEFEPPKHGNLTAWAKDGVLMLNTCLTVKAREAGSHSQKGWEEFTDKVVDVVDKYGGANLATKDSSKRGFGQGVVFLAWGAWAAKRVAKLSKTKHLILNSAHPSPFSANKGFLGNGHFKAANDWLEQKYGPEGCVNWCNLDRSQ